MKNRLLIFLIMVALAVTPLLSGCTGSGSPDDVAVDDVANAFKTELIVVPDGYDTSYEAVVLTADRVYVLGHHLKPSIEDDNAMVHGSPVIVSCGLDGADVKIEDAPYESVERFGILSDGSFVYLQNFYDYAVKKSDFWLKKVDTSGNEVFSVNVTDILMNMPDVARDMFDDVKVSDLLVDGGDRVYLHGGNTVLVFSPDSGEVLFDVTVHHVESIVKVDDSVAAYYNDGSGSCFHTSMRTNVNWANLCLWLLI
jgi:hypothetical protein